MIVGIKFHEHDKAMYCAVNWWFKKKKFCHDFSLSLFDRDFRLVLMFTVCKTEPEIDELSAVSTGQWRCRWIATTRACCLQTLYSAYLQTRCMTWRSLFASCFVDILATRSLANSSRSEFVSISRYEHTYCVRQKFPGVGSGGPAPVAVWWWTPYKITSHLLGRHAKSGCSM